MQTFFNFVNMKASAVPLVTQVYLINKKIDLGLPTQARHRDSTQVQVLPT